MRFPRRSLHLLVLGLCLFDVVRARSASGQAPAPDSIHLAASPPTEVAPSASPPAPVSAPATSVVLASEEGFGLRSADGAFALQFRGGAQYDGRFFPDDPGNAAVDGFDLRRLRADLRGTLYRDYDFRVNLDYAGNRVDVLDAYLEARLSPALQVRVGKFKEPVGLERLQSVFALTFAERGFPTTLAPNRDVGGQLQGALGGALLTYALGVFNGVADGGSGDQDLSDDKDFAGRIFVHPFARSPRESLEGLGFGVAGTVGDQQGTLTAAGLPSLRTPVGRSTFVRYRADGTPRGTVVTEGRRTRLSPQGYWYWRNLGVLGEYIRTETKVRRDRDTADLTQSAWQIAGSWVLTGERPSYRGVAPTRPFDRATGGWGAWELALRAQGLRGDRGAFPLLVDPARAALSATGYTIGVNWYLNRNVRFLTNYEHTRFEAPPGGIGLPAEGVLVSRFQVAF